MLDSTAPSASTAAAVSSHELSTPRMRSAARGGLSAGPLPVGLLPGTLEEMCLTCAVLVPSRGYWPLPNRPMPARAATLLGSACTAF